MRVISECLNNFDNPLQSLVQETEQFFSNFQFLVTISLFCRISVILKVRNMTCVCVQVVTGVVLNSQCAHAGFTVIDQIQMCSIF